MRQARELTSAQRRAITWFVPLAGLAPIALVEVDVARHAQNVPFRDEWHDPIIRP